MPEKTPVMSFVGERLTWARETAGLSQSQLARKSSCTVSMIAEWEEDLCPVGYSIVFEMALICDVDPNWLATGTERPVDLSFLGQDVSEEDRETVRRVLARRYQNS